MKTNTVNTANNIEKDLKNMINKKEEKAENWNKIRAFSDLYSDAFREILIKAN